MIVQIKKTPVKPILIVNVAPKCTYRKSSFFSRLDVSWKEFCDRTKLAGLNLIGGYRKTTLSSRLILLIIWLTCLLVAAYKSGSCVLLYYKRNVQTRITYHTNLELQFPAITICNIIGFRKSIIGSEKKYIDLLSHLMVTNDKELQVVKEENILICHRKSVSSTEANEIGKQIITLVQKSDSEGFYKFASLDASAVVKKCWWNRDEINCSNIFLNHQIDGSTCFTFNQNPNYIDYNKGGLGLAVYGMNSTDYNSKSLQTYGPYSGLKLLLDVHQEEYCMTKMQRSGAGLNVFLHDSRSQATFSLDSTVQLSPGYEYVISMTPVSYDRRNFTESLGKCTSYVYNFLNPDLTDYNQESCFASCFAETVWNRCKCLPVDETRLNFIKRSAFEHLGLKNQSLTTCGILDNIQRNCWANEVMNYNSQNPDVICPRCQRSCFQTQYDFKVTAKKLSHRILKTISKKHFNMIRLVEKNFIMCSFTFDNLDEIRVTEVQAYTVTDLYTSIGGTLGLFLGFSSISIYEVVHQLLITCSILLQKFSKRRKLQKKVFIRKNVTAKEKPKKTAIRKICQNPKQIYLKDTQV